jgi:hypothetical protein
MLRKLRVFLCHASQDKPVVRELYQRLLAEGWIDPWLDEEKLLPGQDWDMEIEKAVESADAVIVCLSSKSATKEGYIQKEIRYVLDIADEKPDGTVFVIPIRIDDCPIPRRLKIIQYVDYFPDFRQGWAYGKIISSISLRSGQLIDKVHILTTEPDKFHANKDEITGAVVNTTAQPQFKWQDQLAGLLGIENVKKWIYDWNSYLITRVEKQKTGRSLSVDPFPPLHLAFMGNPGVGKTTIARIVTSMYKDVGVLSRGQLVAVVPVDLVGGYVGETSIRANAVIEKAYGGVLYIDEAHQLADRDKGGFGQEALDVLISKMDKLDFAIIFSGYTDRMLSFLNSVPGLQARFPRTSLVNFPDFLPNDLLGILLGIFRDKGLTWSPEMENVLRLLVDHMYRSLKDIFGNAREMRSLAEAIEISSARRRFGQKSPFDTMLIPEDIPDSYRSLLKE